MKVRTHPDTITLTPADVERILREHIERHTDRKVERLSGAKVAEITFIGRHPQVDVTVTFTLQTESKEP